MQCRCLAMVIRFFIEFIVNVSLECRVSASGK